MLAIGEPGAEDFAEKEPSKGSGEPTGIPDVCVK
jgi:hypothetical protein